MNTEVAGMNAVVASLETSLSASTLWQVFANIVPLIATITLVSLGFYLIKRAVKRLSKMRGGI